MKSLYSIVSFQTYEQSQQHLKLTLQALSTMAMKMSRNKKNQPWNQM